MMMMMMMIAKVMKRLKAKRSLPQYGLGKDCRKVMRSVL